MLCLKTRIPCTYKSHKIISSCCCFIPDVSHIKYVSLFTKVLGTKNKKVPTYSLCILTFGENDVKFNDGMKRWNHCTQISLQNNKSNTSMSFSLNVTLMMMMVLLNMEYQNELRSKFDTFICIKKLITSTK